MRVSIVMPLRNEEKRINKCLDSIVGQDYPKDKLEVILVDGLSEDGTREVIGEYMAKFPFITLLDNEHKIVPAAMNLGITEASGDLIIRMDAHTIYKSNYISKCVEWSHKTKADNVGGPMRAVGEGYIGKAIEFAHHSPFGLGGGKFHNTNYSGCADTVYLGAFRKDVFERVGAYDERLIRNQDIELNCRIRKAGGECYLTPEINSTYYCRSTLYSLWKQNFGNGLWSIYTSKITKQALSIRHFVPLVFVTFLLCSVLLAAFGLFAAEEAVASFFVMPVSLCLGAYLLANVMFSIKISIAEGYKYLPVLPLVFATLHFSYGLGSLKGLMTVNKWKASWA